jgi:arylsulfatase A-like enzyme
MDSRPNVLLIILDTQRRDRLSLYDYSVETSPALDNFSQDGTVFERAIAPAQWTIPVHASLFTGLYPSSHQLTQASQQLSHEFPTLAEMLQVEDYKTVAFCNNPLLGLLNHGLQRGFSEFYNYAGARPDRPIDLSRNPMQRATATQFRLLARNIANQFANSNALFNLGVNPLFVPIWTRLVNFKGSTERSINDLIQYWENYHAGGREKPIFAFLNLMGTHTPYHPPKSDLEHIAPGLLKSKAVSRFMAHFNSHATDWLSPVEEALEDWQHHTLDALYSAEIRHQDRHLGRLFSYLKESGTLDNTCVIIAADHGEGHGEHGYHGHSFVVYQELVHVPLVIHFPEKFVRGKRIKGTISTRRLFHTILDIAGICPPLDVNSPHARVQELSLVSIGDGKADIENETAFAEAFPPEQMVAVLNKRKPELLVNRQLTKVRRGVYINQYKMTAIEQQLDGLYNTAKDPFELNDIADNNQAILLQLQKTLSNFLSSMVFHEQDALRPFAPEVLENLRALGYID